MKFKVTPVGDSAINYVAIFIIVFLCAGCPQNTSLSSEKFEGEVRVIENVPFVQQKNEFCGPAAMASVMGYYGDEVSQDEVAEEVYTPKLKGALISDMHFFAEQRGYEAKTTNGRMQSLLSQIDDGFPVIALVDLGKWMVSIPHYYVVYGYNENKNTLLLHTGTKEAKHISFSEFEAEWEKMNRLMLVIRK